MDFCKEASSKAAQGLLMFMLHHITQGVYSIWFVSPSDTQDLCNFHHHQQFCNNTSKR